MKGALLKRGRRSGVAVVYMAILGTVLCGFVSLGVDWGHVQLVKTELQAAADAASRAAATQLPNGVTATQNMAALWAGYNKAGSTQVVIDGTNDVEFGTWDTTTRTFTTLSGAARTTANAVRVWARRTTAKGNATALSFGALVGKGTCDINTSSVATYTLPPSPYITGLNLISLHNNDYIASYDSSSLAAPTHATSTTGATLQSNGSITGGPAHDTLQGNVNLGPSGSDSNINISGSTNTLSKAVQPVTLPAMMAVTNPGGVSATPSVSGTVSWPGGTYYFTSLTMANSSTINFTGPATVYMNGNVTLGNNCTITPFNSRPGNLIWYQANATTFTITNNGASLGGAFIGPGADFSAQDNSTLMGLFEFKTLTLQNNDDIYMDTSITSIGPGAIGLVK